MHTWSVVRVGKANSAVHLLGFFGYVTIYKMYVNTKSKSNERPFSLHYVLKTSCQQSI